MCLSQPFINTHTHLLLPLLPPNTPLLIPRATNQPPPCYVGFFDGMDDGMLRANVTEAKIDNVSVRFVRPKLTGDSELEYSVYDEGRVVKADKIIEASGFKVCMCMCVEGGEGRVVHSNSNCDHGRGLRVRVHGQLAVGGGLLGLLASYGWLWAG